MRSKSIYASAKKVHPKQKIFLRNVVDKTCFESYTEFCRMSTAKNKKFFQNAVDKLGFGEKYIRDFEKSKEQSKCLLMSKCVKIIDNN